MAENGVGTSSPDADVHLLKTSATPNSYIIFLTSSTLDQAYIPKHLIA
jgi:hypothetical protein